MKDSATLAETFRLLGQPIRIQILLTIGREEACVCHIEAVLGTRQSTISQHLMVLREAGLVGDRRDGWNVFYHIARPEIFAVIEGAQAALGLSRPRSSRKYPEADCPCPKCSQTDAATPGGIHA